MAQEEFFNKRIPELDELLRRLRNDDLIVVYDHILDKTFKMRGKNIVAAGLVSEDEYIVYHYPADVDGGNPRFFPELNTMVMKDNKLYRLSHPSRPYGSVNFEEELGLGHWVLVSGSGAGGEIFESDFIVKLAGGKTFGKYVNGQMVPAAGKTPKALLLDMAVERMVASASMSSLPKQEQGSTPTITISGSINQGDATAISGRQILKDGVLFTTFANGLSYSATDTPTVDTTYSFAATAEYSNGDTEVIEAQRSIDFDIIHWFGPSGSNPTSASVRNLDGVFASNSSATLNSGSSEKDFYIVVAPGKKLKLVTDLETNATLTEQFVLVDQNFSANDAGGTPVAGYYKYHLSQAVPFSTNHRLSFTLANR